MVDALIPWGEMIVIAIIILPVLCGRIRSGYGTRMYRRYTKRNKIHFFD